MNERGRERERRGARRGRLVIGWGRRLIELAKQQKETHDFCGVGHDERAPALAQLKLAQRDRACAGRGGPKAGSPTDHSLITYF